MKIINPWWHTSGRFDLSDTDNHVGSLFSIDDIMVILSIPSETRQFFYEMLKRKRILIEDKWVPESELDRNWKCLMNFCSQETPKRYQSLFELELKAVIKKVYGHEVNVEPQFKTDKYYVDLKATYKDYEYYIEFIGPQHFEDEKIEKDSIRNHAIEITFNSDKCKKLIEWPYWVQLCERNVKIIFEEETLNGIGALWSTRYLWGGVSDKVREKILELSRQFNIIQENGIGYIYERRMDNVGNEIKPEHPIIERIINSNKYTIDDLLPMNIGNEGKRFWLPPKLWNRI